MVNPNDPAEKELQKLMVEDEAALNEVDKWIRDNNAFTAQGAGEPREALNRRILARFELVRKDYEDLLRRYPDFARGHLAYGSFLNDIGEEAAAEAQYGRAAQLDPKNPDNAAANPRSLCAPTRSARGCAGSMPPAARPPPAR